MSVKRSNLTIINICDKDNSPTHTSLLVLKSRYFTRASFELVYALQATRALLTKFAVTTSCPIQVELSWSGNCHSGICNKQPENCEHHTHRRTKCEPFKTRATRHQFLPLHTLLWQNNRNATHRYCKRWRFPSSGGIDPCSSFSVRALYKNEKQHIGVKYTQ